MAIFINSSVANSVSGLGTFQRTIGTAGMHRLSIQTMENPPSGMSIVINQNGSSVASASSPAASQQVINLQIVVNCALNDVITFVLSSSAASDNQPNGVNSLITVDRISG